MPKNYTAGLNFSGPIKGETNWDGTVDALYQIISKHKHAGSGDGNPVSLTGSGYIDIKQYGAVGDGVADDSPVFNSAIQSFSADAGGGQIIIPRGIYRLASSIHIQKQCILMGVPTRALNNLGAAFKPDAGVTAFIFEGINTTPTFRADDSILENVTIDGSAGTAPSWQATHTYTITNYVVPTQANAQPLFTFHCTTSGTSSGSEPNWATVTTEGGTIADGSVTWTAVVIAGIRMRVTSVVRNVTIKSMAGNGIVIRGNTGDSPSTLADSWLLDRINIQGCRLNGLYASGSDVNVGEFRGAGLLQGNNYWGLWDSGFLGSGYYDINSATNGLGSYKTDNNNAQHVFVGCYHETDQPVPSLVYPTLVVGGTMAQNAPVVTGGGNILRSSTNSVQASSIFANGTGSVEKNRGQLGDNSPAAFIASAYTLVDAFINNTDLRLSYSTTGPYTGYWRWSLVNADTLRPMMVATANNVDGVAAGMPVFPKGYGLAGPGISAGVAPTIISGSVSPASGTFKVGDFVHNTAPAELGSGGSKYVITGWICTVAGTPGTFLQCRSLTGN